MRKPFWFFVSLSLCAWNLVGFVGEITGPERELTSLVLLGAGVLFQGMLALFWLREIRAGDRAAAVAAYEQANEDRLCECGHLWVAHLQYMPSFWRWLIHPDRREARTCRRCVIRSARAPFGGVAVVEEAGGDVCERFTDTGRRDRSISAW